MKYDLSNTLDLNKFKTRIDKLISAGKLIELKEIFPKRTLDQNAYIHVLFGLFGIEYGLTLDESKQLIKGLLLKYEKRGKEFVKQTSKLDKLEMTRFIDKFRMFSSEQGCYLPTPDEYRNKWKDFHNIIEQHEKYLK